MFDGQAKARYVMLGSLNRIWAHLCLSCLLGLATLSGCKSKADARKQPNFSSSVQAVGGTTMGTTYSIKYVPPKNFTSADHDQLCQRVTTELELVNHQMSTYDPKSEISQFNASPAQEWFPVAKEFVDVVALGQQVSELSDGAFDITVGPLVDLWGFGPDGRPNRIPSEKQISNARSLVDFRAIEIQVSPPALRKKYPEIEIDLSAIAKGHGVDRVVSCIEDFGIKNYFVEIGGEVRVKGRKLDGSAWRVGIESPIVDRREILCVLELAENALASSGSYRNFYTQDGQVYSHTIDPRTGYPVDDAIVSASVVSESCAMADSIATSMMSLGYAEGLEKANEHGWLVMLIGIQDGVPMQVMSDAFRQHYPSFDGNLARLQLQLQEP